MRTRTFSFFVTMSTLLCFALPSFAQVNAQKKRPKKVRPKIEVVFALDTTGSMSNLIEVAKSKIWSIANQLVTAKPRPEIKIGLIAYRDIGDAYVTQITPLTDDIDDIYEKLHALRAEGGGDGPEHVNQALSDALTKIQWDKRKNVLRLIFLAGDAIAHDDYQDGLNSSKLAKAISQAGIHLNTIRCGSDSKTQAQFKALASLGNGDFSSIVGGTRVVTTPYDKKLSKLNSELADTMVGYGNRATKRRAKKKSAARKGLSASAAAENASYSAKSSRMNKEDLLQALDDGAALESIVVDHLPTKMQKMTEKKRKQYIEKMQKKRAKIKKKILALSKKRDAHLKKKRLKSKSKNSFDSRVVKTLSKQAKAIHVVY